MSTTDSLDRTLPIRRPGDLHTHAKHLWKSLAYEYRSHKFLGSLTYNINIDCKDGCNPKNQDKASDEVSHGFLCSALPQKSIIQFFADSEYSQLETSIRYTPTFALQNICHSTRTPSPSKICLDLDGGIVSNAPSGLRGRTVWFSIDVARTIKEGTTPTTAMRLFAASLWRLC